MAEIIKYIDPCIVGGDDSGDDSWENAYSSMNDFDMKNLVSDKDTLIIYRKTKHKK